MPEPLMTLGQGLHLFISEKDLRLAGFDRSVEMIDDQLLKSVRVALRLFNAVPAYQTDHGDVPEIQIDIERDMACRGYSIRVSSPTLSIGHLKMVPLVIEPVIENTERDGVHFAISGYLKAVPAPDRVLNVNDMTPVQPYDHAVLKDMKVPLDGIRAWPLRFWHRLNESHSFKFEVSSTLGTFSWHECRCGKRKDG